MNCGYWKRGSCLMAALSIGIGALVSGYAQQITWLGVLPGEAAWKSSAASDVSADGRVVVGTASLTYNDGYGHYYSIDRAFLWTVQTGMQDLGAMDENQSSAYAVSADGNVVVGRVRGWRARAFRWQNGVMQDLGTFGGLESEAHGVSADGSVVVGWAYDNSGNIRAFRWQNGTMQDLGSLGGGSSLAFDVSLNGSVVVGYAWDSSGRIRAFRWQNENMLNLGSFGVGSSEAFGVSPDGGVVVGLAYHPDGRKRAFRWTAQTGMQNLGTWESLESVAYDASMNGQVIVGAALSSWSHSAALRWRQGSGIENLNQTYANLLTPNSKLLSANAVSLDGRYIVGWGYNAARYQYEAFLLDTWRTGDTNGDGCIDDADLLNVLFAFGTAGTGYTRHEDINKDGIVDDADLLTVLFSFGQGC